MKTRFYPLILTLIFGFTLILPVTAFGQGTGPSVRFNVGSGIPTGLIEDVWTTGWTAGFGTEFKVANAFSLRPTADYTRIPLDDDSFFLSSNGTVFTDLSGGQVGILRVMLDGVLRFETGMDLTPYVLAGAGYHRVSVNDLDAPVLFTEIKITEGGSENALGVNLGGGAEYSLNKKIGLFLELEYSSSFIEGDNASYVGTRLGLVLNSWQ